MLSLINYCQWKRRMPFFNVFKDATDGDRLGKEEFHLKKGVIFHYLTFFFPRYDFHYYFILWKSPHFSTIKLYRDPAFSNSLVLFQMPHTPQKWTKEHFKSKAYFASILFRLLWRNMLIPMNRQWEVAVRRKPTQMKRGSMPLSMGTGKWNSKEKQRYMNC